VYTYPVWCEPELLRAHLEALVDRARGRTLAGVKIEDPFAGSAQPG
jgi:hypothetical protein